MANYFNSTVERKIGICCDCGNDTFLTAERCTFCYSTYRKKLMLERQKEKSKIRSLINSKPNKELLVKKGKIVDNDLELWYLARRYQMVGYCINCGNQTQPKHDKYYRWNIAHVCPKSIIKSVAINYHNWLELCQQCHQEYDNNFLKASEMKCFSEAKRKFELFRYFIPPEEMRKVNPYLFQSEITTDPPCAIDNNQ